MRPKVHAYRLPNGAVVLLQGDKIVTIHPSQLSGTVKALIAMMMGAAGPIIVHGDVEIAEDGS